MKNLILSVVLFIILICNSVESISKSRIGVYDSRMIAIWYYQGDSYIAETKKIMDDYLKAVAEKDSVRANAIQEERVLTQRIMHDKGFGKGSVAEILEKKNDLLKRISETEKLIAIVSKWELNYAENDIDIIDITIPLLIGLGANEKQISMYDNFIKIEPVKNAFYMNVND